MGEGSFRCSEAMEERTMSTLRICEMPDCATKLSSYNLGPYCWNHTADIPRSADLRRRPDQVSERFANNISGAYELDDLDDDGTV